MEAPSPVGTGDEHPPDESAAHEPAADDDGAGSRQSPFGTESRRRTAVSVLAAALLGAGAWTLIGHVADFGHLERALRHAGPGWLVTALAGALAGYLGYAGLYRTVARAADGPQPSGRLTLRLTVAVFGASVLATSAGRLGTEYWSLRRMHERAPAAWARTLAVNIAAWAVLAGLAMAAALVAWGRHDDVPWWLLLLWGTALPVCGAAATYATSPRHPEWIADRGGPMRRTLAAGLRGVALVRWTSHQRRDLAGMVGGALLYWGGELLTVWAALHAFGIGLGFGPLVLGYTTGFLATMLPLPAGGAGGVDAAATYALTLVGVPLGPALLAALVQRLCTYWLPLGIAAVRAPAIRRLPAQLAAVPAPAAGTADRRTLNISGGPS